jgi:hypothetical protein
MAALAIAHTEGDDQKHAWLPGQETTLCGIEVTSLPGEFRRFPPSRGRTCHDCVLLAWKRYGRG